MHPSIFINDTGGGNLLQLQTGGANRFVVDNSGNVGIGTAGPDSTLHVIGGVCIETEDTGCAAGTGDLIVSGGDITGANSVAIDLGEAGDNDIYFYADADTSNYLRMATGTEVATETVSALYWEGIETYSNAPGFSVNDLVTPILQA